MRLRVWYDELTESARDRKAAGREAERERERSREPAKERDITGCRERWERKNLVLN